MSLTSLWPMNTSGAASSTCCSGGGQRYFCSLLLSPFSTTGSVDSSTRCSTLDRDRSSPDNSAGSSPADEPIFCQPSCHLIGSAAVEELVFFRSARLTIGCPFAWVNVSWPAVALRLGPLFVSTVLSLPSRADSPEDHVDLAGPDTAASRQAKGPYWPRKCPEHPKNSGVSAIQLNLINGAVMSRAPCWDPQPDGQQRYCHGQQWTRGCAAAGGGGFRSGAGHL